MVNRLSPPYSTQWLWFCSGRRYALPCWRMQQPVQSELRGLLQPGERRVDHRGSHEHQKKWAGCGRGTCLPILRPCCLCFYLAQAIHLPPKLLYIYILIAQLRLLYVFSYLSLFGSCSHVILYITSICRSFLFFPCPRDLYMS